MHNLLKRQLKKFFGSDTALTEELKGFVAAINESYEAFENDRKMLHRAVELSSEELTQSNSELRAVFEAIPDLILRLDQEGNVVPLKAPQNVANDPDAPRFDKRRISSRIEDIPDPDIREPFQRALRELFEDKQPKNFEYSTQSELGEAFFEARLLPLLDGGAITIIQDVTQRRLALAQHEELNRQLIKASRQAGMAEVATGVLHNVGNVLNSVNVAAALLRDRLGKSQIQNLLKAVNLLAEHANDTTAYLTSDPRGQRLPAYLIKLSDHLAAEQSALKQELDGLGKDIEHIKEIVTMQQSYARLSGITEILSLQELVEDALRMNEGVLKQDGIRLLREYQPAPMVKVDKHKVLQILINLIRNAKHAMDDSGRSDKTLTINVHEAEPARVRISVRDNGIGIPPENLIRIFQHGFTTKKDGHGFGLHSSVNSAREMGGDLTVHSDGPHTGTTFILELPAASATAGILSKSHIPLESQTHHTP